MSVAFWYLRLLFYFVCRSDTRQIFRALPSWRESFAGSSSFGGRTRPSRDEPVGKLRSIRKYKHWFSGSRRRFSRHSRQSGSFRRLRRIGHNSRCRADRSQFLRRWKSFHGEQIQHSIKFMTNIYNVEMVYITITYNTTISVNWLTILMAKNDWNHFSLKIIK